MTLKSVYKQNQSFFLGYFSLLIVAVFVLLADSKKAGFILLNPYHTDFLNYFFEAVTLVGDGFFSVAVCLVLLIIKKRHLSFMIFASYATSGIVAQILKAFISEARPALFLKKGSYPYFIDHVTLHNFHSFPSGHSASAFALAAIIAFAIKDKRYSIPFLGIAALVGYSRIYLGQHFLHDVVAGSLIGVIFAVICWIGFAPFYEKLNKKRRNHPGPGD